MHGSPAVMVAVRVNIVITENQHITHLKKNTLVGYKYKKIHKLQKEHFCEAYHILYKTYQEVMK